MGRMATVPLIVPVASLGKSFAIGFGCDCVLQKSAADAGVNVSARLRSFVNSIVVKMCLYAKERCRRCRDELNAERTGYSR